MPGISPLMYLVSTVLYSYPLWESRCCAGIWCPLINFYNLSLVDKSMSNDGFGDRPSQRSLRSSGALVPFVHLSGGWASAMGIHPTDSTPDGCREDSRLDQALRAALSLPPGKARGWGLWSSQPAEELEPKGFRCTGYFWAACGPEEGGECEKIEPLISRSWKQCQLIGSGPQRYLWKWEEELPLLT